MHTCVPHIGSVQECPNCRRQCCQLGGIALGRVAACSRPGWPRRWGLACVTAYGGWCLAGSARPGKLEPLDCVACTHTNASFQCVLESPNPECAHVYLHVERNDNVTFNTTYQERVNENTYKFVLSDMGTLYENANYQCICDGELVGDSALGFLGILPFGIMHVESKSHILMAPALPRCAFYMKLNS